MVGWLPIPIVDMKVAGSTRSRVAELDRKKPAGKASGRSERRTVARARQVAIATWPATAVPVLSPRGLRQADAALSVVALDGWLSVSRLRVESWAA